jgi:hypothetical protein
LQITADDFDTSFLSPVETTPPASTPVNRTESNVLSVSRARDTDSLLAPVHYD